MLEWIKLAEQYNEETYFEVIRWVQECLNTLAKSGSAESLELSSSFTNLASLVSMLAATITPDRQVDIREEVISSLPGLSSKVTVFREGEVEKAQKWIRSWLRENTQDYLKIVDPYFGPEQVVLFSELPKNVKILVVTTDHYFKELGSPEKIEAHLNFIWDKYGKGKLPQMNIIIVPQHASDSFHDRVIITKTKGLGLGQSLNGLGLKMGKLTDLPPEDAREVEVKYVDAMLNNNQWFMDKSIQPMVIRLGV